MRLALVLAITLTILFFATSQLFNSTRVYKITAYCAGPCCCAPHHDGFTASGLPVKVGYVACNHFEFGTKLSIGDLGEFEVQDRGSKRYFGSMVKVVRAIDVYMPEHQDAVSFGVRYRIVEVVR